MIQKTLIAVLLLIGIHSFAQLNKNRVMISGRGNVYMNKSEDNNIYAHIPTEKHFGGTIYLNAGYFLSNNFAVGGVFGSGKSSYNRNSKSVTNDRTIQETTSKSFTAGIFARYNQMIRQSKFGLFCQVENSYSWGKYDDIIAKYPGSGGMTYITRDLQKNNTFKIGLTPGLMYFVTNRLSIEASIGDISYNSIVTKYQPVSLQPNTQKDNLFNANFSMATAYFGLTFYLGGKKNEDTKIDTSESK
jgi:hypothetical protein